MKSLLKLIIAVSAVSMFGCATGHQAVESESTAMAKPVQSIAVVAIGEDLEQRAEFEEVFGAALQGAGVDAVTSHEQMADLKALENPKAVEEFYKLSGADSGLTIELLEAPSESAVKARKASNAAWWAALLLDEPEIRRLAAASSLASYSRAGQYKLRLVLWDAKSGAKLWSMNTESFTNGNRKLDARRLAEMAGEELRNQGLLS